MSCTASNGWPENLPAAMACGLVKRDRQWMAGIDHASVTAPRRETAKTAERLGQCKRRHDRVGQTDQRESLTPGVGDENERAAHDAPDQDARGADRPEQQTWVGHVVSPVDQHEQELGPDDPAKQGVKRQVEDLVVGEFKGARTLPEPEPGERHPEREQHAVGRQE